MNNYQINIQGNSVEISGNSRIDTRTSGIGKGADIVINASNGGSIYINSSVLDAATYLSNQGGDGGNISLTTNGQGSIQLTKSTIFTDTFGYGNGGDITIKTEGGSVSLDGFIPPELKYYDGEISLVATVNENASGQGGNIYIEAESLDLKNQAKIQTQTNGTPDTIDSNKNAQAGNITVNVTDFVNLSGNSQLNAKTTGSANAGDVEITANKLTVDRSQVITTSDGSGNAGDLTVKASSVLLRGNQSTNFRDIVNSNNTPEYGLLAEATQPGGTAGNLKITTDELRIENGAAATVSSPQGQAGDVEISANKIFLDNGGLLATTGINGDGANIILKGNDNSSVAFVILWNESLIAANAQGNATGGNININSQLLLGLPPRESRVNAITANAEDGTGGQVNIRAGIYGFSRSTLNPSQLSTYTENNYIAASSNTGAAGDVAVGQPIVDPNRGLIQLPEDLGDSSKLIAQSCPVGGQQATSSFVVTGRGGLPPNPGSALSSGALVGNSGSSPPEQTSSASPVEAQGVNLGPNGEIILTANPKKPASNNSWQRFVGCYGK